MDKYISTFNQIQDQFKLLEENPIELPQIVVVGSQSSGKSSVLESLVQRSFLPRGGGIVTRCPLILQLHHCPNNDARRYENGVPATGEWAEFPKVPGKIFKMEQVCVEIQRETVELAGPGKNICNDPITVKIFSPNVLDLTLVDLPGITKVPVDGQPDDISRQIEQLILSYIQRPLSIILAIVAANVDMVTNDCLRIAREVDPEGRRTLGVVTKVDMVGDGDDAYDILTGKSVSLKLGIIGVVNRSQKDINNEKPIEECLKRESAFFKQKYPDLASRMGTSYLLKELSSLLLDHVKKCLPSLRVKVRRQIQDCENKLEVTGSQVDDSDEFLRDVIAQFFDAFCRKLESQTPNIERAALFGGARVCLIFNQLKKSLQEVAPCDKYCVEEVVMAIRNADGTRPPILVSLYAFEALMKPLIEKMLPLSIGCVRLVMDELQAVSEDSLPKKVEKFPILKQETDTIVRKVIQECAVKAKEMIKDLNEIELGHITYDEFECIEELFAKTAADATLTLPFKSDPDFLNRLTENEAVKIFPDLVTELEPKHQKQIMVLGKMLKHYYDVVAKTVSDGVCKTIMTYLVNRVKRNLAVRLMTHLFQADLQDDLFQEDEKTVQLRAETTTKLEVLKNVERVLSNVL